MASLTLLDASMQVSMPVRGKRQNARAPHGKRRRDEDGYRLEPDEVVAAVSSLYDDKIQPVGRIVLKRVGERAALAAAAEALEKPASQAAEESSSKDSSSNEESRPAPFNIDPKHLRKVCETCEQLRVVVEDGGGEYVALLRHRDSCFKDVCDPVDSYPKQLWDALTAYFQSLGTDGHEEEALLPGGRYACARELVNRGLDCLTYRSLGEICHIVQLAVTKRKILGYHGGNLVPFRLSEMSLKEQCALSQSPVSTMKHCKAGDDGDKAVTQLPLATWEDLRFKICDLLEAAGNGSLGSGGVRGRGSNVSVPLPNVKRIFRSRYGLELSETTLGYSRLFELLHDPRLADICKVHLQNNNWVVAKPESTPLHSSCPEAPMLPASPSVDFESESHGSSSPAAASSKSPANAGYGYYVLPVPMVDPATGAVYGSSSWMGTNIQHYPVEPWQAQCQMQNQNQNQMQSWQTPQEQAACNTLPPQWDDLSPWFESNAGSPASCWDTSPANRLHAAMDIMETEKQQFHSQEFSPSYSGPRRNTDVDMHEAEDLPEEAAYGAAKSPFGRLELGLEASAAAEASTTASEEASLDGRVDVPEGHVMMTRNTFIEIVLTEDAPAVTKCRAKSVPPHVRLCPVLAY